MIVNSRDVTWHQTREPLMPPAWTSEAGTGNHAPTVEHVSIPPLDAATVPAPAAALIPAPAATPLPAPVAAPLPPTIQPPLATPRPRLPAPALASAPVPSPAPAPTSTSVLSMPSPTPIPDGVIRKLEVESDVRMSDRTRGETRNRMAQEGAHRMGLLARMSRGA